MDSQWQPSRHPDVCCALRKMDQEQMKGYNYIAVFAKQGQLRCAAQKAIVRLKQSCQELIE